MEKKIRYFIWAGVDKKASSITDLSSTFDLESFAAQVKEKPHRKKLLDLIADAEKELPLMKQEFEKQLDNYPKGVVQIIAGFCNPSLNFLAHKVAQEKVKENPKKS